MIVDLAADSGGNVQGTQQDQEVEIGGVKIVGLSNMPARVANDASLMYSNNVGNLITHFWDKESASFTLNREDEIIAGCLLTHAGEVLNDRVKKSWKGA